MDLMPTVTSMNNVSDTEDTEEELPPSPKAGRYI